ncbi:hypothetical protein HOG21_06430 [bacterium]|jgi:hypothetical protein|nr:hypothetical protein [bacterium]
MLLDILFILGNNINNINGINILITKNKITKGITIFIISYLSNSTIFTKIEKAINQ